MRFEDLDKRIKEAADQHHPAYDEKAWHKMERLLDQHLPKPKNDRRRILFLLLTFLLVGGGTFVVVSRPWESESKIAVQSSQPNSNSPTSTNDQNKTAPANRVTATEIGDNKEQKRKAPSEDLGEKPTSKGAETDLALRPLTSEKNPAATIQDKNRNDQRLMPEIKGKNTSDPRVEEERKMLSNNKEVEPNLDVPAINPNKANIEDVKKGEVKPVKEADRPNVANAEQLDPKAKKAAKPLNRNGFSFSVSVGPDLSKAGSSKAGEVTLAYGAGVGYTLNRFTLRTGIYAAKKIYWANADDYKLSYVPPSTAQFEGSDANCYVIDVPVKLSYNFGFSNKNHWFAGAGISSYFMKRETYNYVYKTSWGPYSYPHEVKNENNHYFSILNLSGGYTHQINKILSISAEPYVELPLTGVGEGQVHLKSAGVLFTLGVKPVKR